MAAGAESRGAGAFAGAAGGVRRLTRRQELGPKA